MTRHSISRGARAARATALTPQLNALYPDPKSELTFSSPYQLVLCVVLSAQCTDKKVNQVTPSLFATYPHFKALADARLPDVEAIIRPINYYRTKSKHLIALANRVITTYAGELPTTYDALRTLPGVGNKTANVVLGELGTAYAFPVDTHVFRVAQRLGLAAGKTPEAVERQLREVIPQEQWRNFHHWLIFHGRRVCKAKAPNCTECTIRTLCCSPQKAAKKVA